jgi:hypothetical protein
MAKNRTVQKPDLDDAFSFMVNDDSMEDSDIIDAGIAGLLETNHQQTEAALELTKLIVNSTPGLNEEKVFNIYREAMKVIMESSPLLNLVEKFTDER